MILLSIPSFCQYLRLPSMVICFGLLSSFDNFLGLRFLNFSQRVKDLVYCDMLYSWFEGEKDCRSDFTLSSTYMNLFYKCMSIFANFTPVLTFKLNFATLYNCKVFQFRCVLPNITSVLLFSMEFLIFTHKFLRLSFCQVLSHDSHAFNLSFVLNNRTCPNHCFRIQ